VSIVDRHRGIYKYDVEYYWNNDPVMQSRKTRLDHHIVVLVVVVVVVVVLVVDLEN